MTVSVLSAFYDSIRPWLPLLVPLFGVLVVVSLPMPGRGPRLFQRRNPWRGFKFAARRAVFDRAGGRCEGALFLAWGRCKAPAVEADHVYPWSRSGPTVLSNGQALCKEHNRRKSNLRPPWWYVRALERRRAKYFPSGTEARFLARMNDTEKAARRTCLERRG